MTMRINVEDDHGDDHNDVGDHDDDHQDGDDQDDVGVGWSMKATSSSLLVR